MEVRKLIFAGTRLFDAVAVCSGPFSRARHPDDINLGGFSGPVFHSSTYKDPSDFHDSERVFVVGAANSAIDISLELWQAGKQVIIFHRKLGDLPGFLDDIVQIRKNILRVKHNEVQFCDSSSISCDAILLCTGFNTDVSFLHKSCGLSVKDGLTVFPLYLYMINPYFPTMALFDRPLSITPFLLCEYQAILFSKLLNKTVIMPSKDKMIKEAFELISVKNKVNDRKLYMLTNSMQNHMDFYRELGNLTGDHLIDYEYGLHLHEKVIAWRNAKPVEYRNWPDSFWDR